MAYSKLLQRRSKPRIAVQGDVADFSLEKAAKFIAHSNVHLMKGHTAVFTDGEPGAGKSTTIGVLMGADYEQGPMGRGGRRTLKPISVDFDIPASDNGLKSRTLVSTLWRRNAPSDGKVEPHWFNMLPQLTKDRMIERIAAGVQQHGVALHSSTQMNMLRTFNQLPITELPITGKQIYELHNYYTSPASGLDDIAFIDLSGKNVSNEHGREMQECQKVDRCACFEVLEEIPALLAVRDYRRLPTSRSGNCVENFEKSARSLYDFVDGQDLSDTMIFVVTNGEVNLQPIHLKEIAEDYVNEQENTMQSKFQELKQLYPRPVASGSSMPARAINAVAAPVGRGVAAAGRARRALLQPASEPEPEPDNTIDWDQVPDREKELLKNKEAGIWEMKQLIATVAKQRVVLSTIFNKTDCRLLRITLGHMLAQTQSITAAKIRRNGRAAMRAEWSTFAEVLTLEANRFNPYLVDVIDKRNRERQLFSENKAIIETVINQAAFKEVKESKQKDTEEDLKGIRKRITKLEEEIQHLQETKTPMRYDNQCKHLLLTRDNWRWKSWIWVGGGYAREQYAYTDRIPFLSWQITPDVHVTWKHKSTEIKGVLGSVQPRLELEIESADGYDFDHKLEVFVEERHHPQTVSMVASKRRELATKEAALESKTAFRDKLNAAQDAEQLKKVIVDGLNEVTEGLEKRNSELHQVVVAGGIINNSFGGGASGEEREDDVLESHVLEGLYNFCRTFTNDEGRFCLPTRSPQISDTGQQAIEEFMNLYDTLETLKQDRSIKEFSLVEESAPAALKSPDVKRKRSPSPEESGGAGFQGSVRINEGKLEIPAWTIPLPSNEVLFVMAVLIPPIFDFILKYGSVSVPIWSYLISIPVILLLILVLRSTKIDILGAILDSDCVKDILDERIRAREEQSRNVHDAQIQREAVYTSAGSSRPEARIAL